MKRTLFAVLPLAIAGLLTVSASAEQPDMTASAQAQAATFAGKIGALKASSLGRASGQAEAAAPGSDRVYADAVDDNVVPERYDWLDSVSLTINDDHTMAGVKAVVCDPSNLGPLSAIQNTGAIEDLDESTDCRTIVFKFDPSVMRLDNARGMFVIGGDDVMKNSDWYFGNRLKGGYQLRSERAQTVETDGFNHSKTWIYKVYLEKSAS